ncbi:MAG: DNA methyltransferase [Bacteroidota bacterium]|nr:DNA methyltransferase [Bacteroidota bacterium]
MNQEYETLKELLKKLFQLDQPDLDFGLYRIMHAKSVEVSRFLDYDLLPQVKAAFLQYRPAEKARLEKELSDVIAGIERAGMNPDESPIVRDLHDRLVSDSADVGALERDVYDHLYSFFRRYYVDGDFLSKRVYKPNVYAIPYEGQEVTLHWANKDQYYIKTSEYLRDYTFRLAPDNKKNPMRVHFRLADAVESEHDNIKVAEDKNRMFILVDSGNSQRDFIAEENGEWGKELVIRFEYRPVTHNDWPAEERGVKKRPPTQKDLISRTSKRILALTGASLTSWIAELGKPHVMANNTRADYCRLEAHLRRYTARNTFDFFIHKDLGSFLRRELDFYIKNEVMHLNDMENESVPRVEQYLSKIKVIRKIAGKIIDFLVQIEEFQKKLWLKKKFVVETHYCISVGRIPEEFYPEIAKNEAQHEEWVRLCAIDQIHADLNTPAYTGNITTAFLKAQPTLVVDTRHFDVQFTAKLIETFSDLDEHTDGVLIHGENTQAMRLASRRYANSIECAYIDPPYNTGNDGFIYRDNYRHSSWLAFIDDRLRAFLPLARNDSSLFVSIDDNEVGSLISLVKEHSASAELVTLIAARLNPRGRTLDKFIAKNHEYVGAFALFGSHEAIRQIPKSIDEQARYKEIDEQGSYRLLELRNRNPVFNRANRPNMFYPFYTGPQGGSVTLEPDPEHSIEVFPRNSRGVDGCWTWGKPRAQKNRKELVARRVRTGAWRIFRKDRLHDDNGAVATKKAKSIWDDREFNNENGKELLGDLFGNAVFDFPKPVALIERCVEIGMSSKKSVFIDFFSGSGTAGHAIINLNRRDGFQRKFILVEMGPSFDTVLVPRIKKVTYSPTWTRGRPSAWITHEQAQNSPSIVKIIRIESYEDTLNNLIINRTTGQRELLNSSESQGTEGFREQFILHYMLNVETRGSQSLLNIQDFIDPTAYKLRVKLPGSDESRKVNLDLLETFNWLIGLKVEHIIAPQTFSAAFWRDKQKRLRLEGGLRPKRRGMYWFRPVKGITSEGRRALVIWRKLTGNPEQDNLVLNEWFCNQGYSDEDRALDIVWVNGGNNLETLRAPGDQWEVRLIEEDFHRLMFDTEMV